MMMAIHPLYHAFWWWTLILVCGSLPRDSLASRLRMPLGAVDLGGPDGLSNSTAEDAFSSVDTAETDDPGTLIRRRVMPPVPQPIGHIIQKHTVVRQMHSVPVVQQQHVIVHETHRLGQGPGAVQKKTEEHEPVQSDLSAENTAKESAEETAEVSDSESAEETAEESGSEGAEEKTETEESGSESAEETSEESGEETTDEETEETQNADETTEQSEDETTEQSAEEAEEPLSTPYPRPVPLLQPFPAPVIVHKDKPPLAHLQHCEVLTIKKMIQEWFDQRANDKAKRRLDRETLIGWLNKTTDLFRAHPPTQPQPKLTPALFPKDLVMTLFDYRTQLDILVRGRPMYEPTMGVRKLPIKHQEMKVEGMPIHWREVKRPVAEALRARGVKWFDQHWPKRITKDVLIFLMNHPVPIAHVTEDEIPATLI
mmetsp:Transcript_20887/g.50928  ORF Transcript_20887/g.50928 Transcript_20887/m.50928 type:complete len:427 (-) Transcript_20887:857-2137(-)